METCPLAENACSPENPNLARTCMTRNRFATGNFFGSWPFGYRQVSLSHIFDLYVMGSAITVFTQTQYWAYGRILAVSADKPI
jgi:hypothetical protein